MRFHSRYFHHTVTALIVLALALAIAPHAVPRAHAQDSTIAFNEPEIVSLAPGSTTRLGFDVLGGDTVEILLSPLAQFTYTAVLIDPSNTPAQLPLGPDGSVSASITNAPTGGRYTLVLQATDVAGQLLVQVNNAPAVPLALGTSTVDLTSVPQRFSLEPDPGPTTLSLLALGTDDDPGLLPAFSLVDAETGDPMLNVQAAMLPGLSVFLRAETAYMLQLQGSESPAQLQIDWTQVPPDEAPPASTSPSSSSSSSDSDSSSTGDSAPPAASGTCEVYLNAPVNVRPGPDTAYAPPLGLAPAGSLLPATGHNGDFSWYQVLYNGQPGWVAMFIGATEARGDCTGLPVASYPPLSGTTPTTTGTPTVTYTPSATYTPTMTYTPGGPTVTPTATPSRTPTYTRTPTATPTTPQQITGPTATYTPSYTPTTQAVAPTPTYTPSYTPTTPPAAPTAPPDANFNSPLTIPLDSTASTTDFVSYPGGDTTDRVRWDITGMNPNAALSGGRARLVIAASCFGTGTQHITFFTGGQTFTCGQTIVDREVTYDSRTGQVTIEAVGGTGTYVQWVLTGSATRVN